MKKKLVLILATLMCLSLCACGGMGNKNEQNNIGQLESNVEESTIDTSASVEESTVDTSFAVEESTVDTTVSVEESTVDTSASVEESTIDTSVYTEESTVEVTTEETMEEKFEGPRYSLIHLQTGLTYDEWMADSNSMYNGFSLSEFLNNGYFIVGCAYSTGGTGLYQQEIIDFVQYFYFVDNYKNKGETTVAETNITTDAISFVGNWYWAPDGMTGITSVDIGPYNGGEILQIEIDLDKVLGRTGDELTGDKYTMEFIIIPE